MSNNDTIVNDLENFKSKYYDDNKKKTFFKKDQKLDLASKVCNEFNIDSLFKKTIYIVTGTNRIFIDYTIFKVYAYPAIFDSIVSYIQQLSMECIQKYGSFECHLNLDTFTVTAAERYQNIVYILCNQPLDGFDYTAYMTNLYVYNIPSSIDMISKILLKFVDPIVKSKIIAYNKTETPNKLLSLGL